MSKLSLIAALVLVVTSTTYSLASREVNVSPTHVPRCEATLSPNAVSQLTAELRLDTKLGSTVDVWNGCLKVTQSGNDGRSTTTFYDPDTLSEVGTLG